MDMERMIQEAYDNGYLRGYEKGKADRPQGEWIEVDDATMKGADDGRHDI